MRFSFVPLTFSAVVLWGCGASGDGDGNTGDDADRPLGPPPIFPVPGCETIEHGVCDVFDPTCRERLMLLAACLRGSDAIPVPPVTAMTKAEYVALVNDRLSANPPPDPNHYERALTLLRVVQPGELSATSIDETNVSVLGFYRNEEKDIVLVEHDASEDETLSSRVLLHEFVHALQDRDVELTDVFEANSESYDSYLGTAAIVEGEARLHEGRFASSLIGLDPAAIDWELRFQSIVDLDEDLVLTGATPYSDGWWFFPYDVGARFANHVWQRDGLAGIRERLESPPKTYPVLASVTGLVEDTWQEPEFVPPDAPEPWTLWGEETLGAWGFFVVMTRQYVADVMRPVALDWRGDRLWIYEDPNVPEQTAMVWNVELATEESAVAVENWAVYFRSYGIEVARSDLRVALTASTVQADLTWALGL